MRYLIIEDEQYAAERLKMIVDKLRPDYELAGTAASVERSVEMLNAEPDIDLCFTDIELQDGSCFSMFDRIQSHAPFIFTTAYDEYALNAFRENSVDYLLKPLKVQEVERALDKFERFHAAARPADYSALLRTLEVLQAKTSLADGSPSRILTVSGDNYGFVDTSDIAFLQSDGMYIYAYTTKGKQRLTRFRNMQEAEAALPKSSFFQLSRSIIASIGSIQKVTKYFHNRLLVTIAAAAEQREVTVSTTRKEDFLLWLGR